jgi:hypothetical protein
VSMNSCLWKEIRRCRIITSYLREKVMLKCTQCESDVKLSWSKYFRAGWKYKVICDSCNSKFKIKLPLVLALLEYAFAGTGTAIIMMIVLILVPTKYFYIEIPIIIITQIPWLIFNFYINKSLDNHFGKLTKLDNKKVHTDVASTQQDI